MTGWGLGKGGLGTKGLGLGLDNSYVRKEEAERAKEINEKAGRIETELRELKNLLKESVNTRIASPNWDLGAFQAAFLIKQKSMKTVWRQYENRRV